MPAQLVAEFDIWREGYDGAVVSILVAGTSTLATIFADEGLTMALPNPQTLDSRTDVNNSSYGRFHQPVYTEQPYYLSIDIGDDTGIKRPGIPSLDGQDASNALVTVAGSAETQTLAAIVARTVFAENYGDIQVGGSVGSAATNTTTITAAIGALGASGIVVLPAGLIRCNAFSLPAGVVLQGQGESATTIQIISAAIAITLTGDEAGFRDMTIDGNALTPGSVGVYAVNRTAPLFENFTIQSFDIGLTFKGCSNPQFRNFSLNDCNTGAQLHGDTDAGGTHAGGPFLGGQWMGGIVSECSTVGIELKYIDAIMAHLAIENVLFDSNVGTAVLSKGAQFNLFNNCRWTNNGLNLDISDDVTVLTPATQYQNKGMGIVCRGGLMSAGSVKVTGNAYDVVFDLMKLLGVTFNLVATLLNNVILKDCFEDSGTVITGSASQLVRQFGEEEFEVQGITTGNVATRAWGITLDDNEAVYFEVKAIGVQRNGVNQANFHAVIGGNRAPGILNYNNQTANFTLGDILTGTNSGATARIVSDSDGGTFGALSLGNIQGTFSNGEIITGSTTGSANAVGTVTDGTHRIDYGMITYGTETSPFTVGNTVTGHASGATAVILAINDSSPTGTLTLGNIVGTFNNAELITDSGTGSATTTSVVTGSLEFLRTPFKTDASWTISFTASPGEIAVLVQGNVSQTIDWTVHIKLVTS